jgi:hypothetical protein
MCHPHDISYESLDTQVEAFPFLLMGWAK